MQHTYIKVKKSFNCDPDAIVPHERTYELYKCKRGQVFKTKLGPSYLNSHLVEVLSIVDVLKMLKKDKHALDKTQEML